MVSQVTERYIPSAMLDKKLHEREKQPAQVEGATRMEMSLVDFLGSLTAHL